MKLKEKVIEILKQQSGLTMDNDPNYGTFFIQTIYTEPHTTLSISTIKDIFASNNPKECLQDILSEWATEYAIDYGYTEIEKTIKDNLTENELQELNSQELSDIISEIVLFKYDETDFNSKVHVNLMLDVGDANYDFACNNALNEYDNYSAKLHENSPIRWLAKQQGELDLLEKELIRVYKTNNSQPIDFVNRNKSTNKFIESVLQELENNGHCCTVLTFLLNMELLELINFKTWLNKAKKETPNTIITIGKNVECGLFAPYVGGGSCLEIECINDIEIPAKYIYDAYIDGTKPYGYDIDEVYGLIDACWHGELKNYDKGIKTNE